MRFASLQAVPIVGITPQQMLQNWINYFEGKLTTQFDDYSLKDIASAMFSCGNQGQFPYQISATFHNVEKISGKNAFMPCAFTALSFPKCKQVVGAQQFQNSQYLQYVNFPALETINNFTWWFFNCKELLTVNLGQITSIANTDRTTFASCIKLTDVYMTSMQSSTLLSYTNMFTESGNYFTPHQVVFHCADGDVKFNEDQNAWILMS